MPRTAAQKAARRSQRLARKAAYRAQPAKQGATFASPPPPRKRKNRNRKNRQRKRGVTTNQITNAYVATLNDPFVNPGIPIGFGCMIPTNIVVAYVKGSLAAGADGSFRLATLPYGTGTAAPQGAILNSSVSLVGAAPVYTAIVSADNTSILANNNFGRVVSGGLRVFVRYPKTSAAGIMSAYSFASTSVIMSNQSINVNLSLPQAKMCHSDEVTISYRPTDYNDMEFIPLSSGVGSGSLGSWQGYIDGTGYPIGATTVYYEAIYHIEAYSTTNVSSLDQATDSFMPSLADMFANAESAVKFVRQHLTPEIVEGASQFLGFRATGIPRSPLTISEWKNDL